MLIRDVLPSCAHPSVVVPPVVSKTKDDTLVTRAELTALCARILDATADRSGRAALQAAGRILSGWLLARREKLDGSEWAEWGRRLARFLLRGGEGRPPLTIFGKGNSKLPYWTFSALPVFTCPGAGACAQWCYSFTAWRYPAPFFCQLQNTLLLRHRPAAVLEAWRRLATTKRVRVRKGADVADLVKSLADETLRARVYALARGKGGWIDLPTTTVRLYVDGDFASLDDVAFWMRAVASRPEMRVYGYSKSWDLLVQYDRLGGRWPGNYVLNLSSGGVAYATREDVSRLPIARGEFLVLDSVRLLKGEGRYQDRTYRDQLRAAAREAGLERAFPCPGDCGTCGNGRPVCASGADGGRRMTLPVIIGAH